MRVLRFLCCAAAALLGGTMLPAAAPADFAARFDALCARATPAQLYTFLYALPKGGDLHNHFGGANHPEWLWAVLTDPARNGGDTFHTRTRFANHPDSALPFVRFRTIRQRTFDALPAGAREEYVPLASLDAATRAAWLSSLRLDRPEEGRDEFFEVSIWTRYGDIYRNPNVVLELLVENLRAFGAEGVRYLELQFGVRGWVDRDGRLLPATEARARLETRLAQPDAVATGVTLRGIETVLRFAPDAERRLVEDYTWVAANRDRWVGLNMAGIEEKGPGYPARFLDTYRQLRRTHPTLPLTIHAGEMDGPDRHIRDTLLLGARRIGHGVNLLKDPDTLLLLQQGGRTLVEINLISNRLLGYVPDLALHPFPEYLRTGIPVCLNTDDRGIWDSNLTDEYFTAVTLFRLSWAEVVQLGRNSLEFSFADAATKSALLAAYEQDVTAFEARFGAGSVDDALAALTSVRPVAYGYARRTWGLQFE